MKQGRLLANGGQGGGPGGLGKDSNEEEKSKLEQIEEEVKSSIFGVFYLLLKNNETSYWKFIAILLIEYIQLLSFSFDETMDTVWKVDNIVNYFAQFLCTFRVVYWLEKLSWDVYIIIFYILVFLVFIIIIDFLYVSISFKNRKMSFTQPIQLLKLACGLIVTVLYIPITQLFLSLSACEQDPEGTSDLVHVVFSTVICFQSIHVVHITISYILLLLFIAICIITLILNYENRYTRDPTSKVNAKSDLMMLLQKSVYVFFYCFFSQEGYQLFKSILLVAFSGLTFASYVLNRPYYSQSTQSILEILSGLFFWTNLVLLFTQVISTAQFTGSLQILFMGIPIICLLIYTRQEDRNKLLLTAETQFQSGDQCQKKNFYYIFIIDTKEQYRQSAILLKGYVNHHSEVCPYDTCPIKAFKRLMLKDKLTAETSRKRKIMSGQGGMNAIGENNQLLLQQGKALYSNGIRKFPKYMPLRIDFANFLQSRMRDRKGALAELANAEKSKPGIEHQFMIFRARRLIEDELAEGSEHGGTDFMAAMNYENMFKQFKQLIEKSALLHFEFWTHLQDDSPDLARLANQGAKINQSILTVEDYWKKLSRMANNAPKALKIYASYLIEVLNDKETGNEQMIKAKEAANMRANFEFGNGASGSQENDVNTYASDGTPCVYISGETDRLGIVNQCNMSLCKIFGYSKKDEILGKNIKMLQPKIFSEHHDELLNVSIQKQADQISSRERQIFGKHFSGYIFPLWLQIKNLPSLLAGRQFVATFKVEKTGVNKSSAYLLFSKDRELVDISPSCLQLLGLTHDSLHKKQIFYDVPSIFPDLFENGKPNSAYLSKAGSRLTYHPPKLQDYSSESKDMNNTAKIYEGSGNGTPNTTGLINQRNENGLNREATMGDGMGDDMDENYTGLNYNPNDGQDQSNNLGRSNSVSHQKSLKSNGERKQAEGDDDESYDDNENQVKFLFRAVGVPEQKRTFQANLNEIWFELLNLQGGFFLRIEQINSSDQANQMNMANANLKRVLQQTFQFSYDPIFKRFNRELRDPENKDFLLDKYFLDLKQKKELSKQDPPADPNILRYANMSYINFLNRNQRMIERGDSQDNFEEDEEEEGQSEEESVDSSESKDDRSRSKANQSKGEQQLNKLENFKPNANLGMMAQGGDFNKMLIVGEGYGREFLKSEIERLVKLLQEKQDVGKDVHTFIRNEGARKGWEEDNNQKAGLFSDRGGDIDKVTGEGDDDEGEIREKSSDKNNDSDSLKASIKSKKAFSMAINDKTMPPAIRKLSSMAQVILLILVVIAISEYAVMYKQFSDTKANFSIMEKAFERTAELQKVAYNARTMIFMSRGIMTNNASYATQAEYVAYIKTQFQSSLDLIYKLQNDINLNQLPVSDEHDQLLNNKTVTLYFKENTYGMKALQFSLTESILQISSTIFTISNMAIASFLETNEDVFFLMYNSFNNFYLALLKSSRLYVEELQDRANEREEISLVLYLLSLFSLIICFFILIPVVHSVNQQKDKVLALFCEIENSAIRVLSNRCEKFITSIQQEEGNDEIDSNEEMEHNMQVEDDADEYGLLSGSGKRTKKAKGKTKTDKNFFFKFFIALCCVHAYYLQNFILNTQAVDASQVLSQELNVTAVTEPFYWFALNAQKEMINNSTRSITLKQPIDVVTTSMFQLYDQQNALQENHLDHQSYLETDYWDRFEEVFREDLCPSITYFAANGTTNCSNFISGTLQQGLHVVTIRYFETLRNTLNQYQLLLNASNWTGINSMVNQVPYYELYVIQNFVTQKLMRELVKKLSLSIQDDFQFRTERKIAIFIVFLIVVLISFIIFWLPFLNGLNYQIYKTKLMLMIIPLELLLKIKNVAKVLQSQSFIQQSSKKSSSGGSGGSGKRKETN